MPPLLFELFREVSNAQIPISVSPSLWGRNTGGGSKAPPVYRPTSAPVKAKSPSSTQRLRVAGQTVAMAGTRGVLRRLSLIYVKRGLEDRKP